MKDYLSVERRDNFRSTRFLNLIKAGESCVSKLKVGVALSLIDG